MAKCRELESFISLLSCFVQWQAM